MQTSINSTIDAGLVWRPVADVQAVVFVARADERPVAVIEFRPGRGFHVTMCTGENLGLFDSLVEGQAAVETGVAGGARELVAS